MRSEEFRGVNANYNASLMNRFSILLILTHKLRKGRKD